MTWLLESLIKMIQFFQFPNFQKAKKICGANRDRTDDLLRAKQALSQLSYGPVSTGSYIPLELLKKKPSARLPEGPGMSGAINLEGRISYFILSDPDEPRILAGDQARFNHL